MAEEKMPGVLTIQSRKPTGNRNLVFLIVLFTYTEEKYLVSDKLHIIYTIM